MENYEKLLELIRKENIEEISKFIDESSCDLNFKQK